MNKRNVFTEKIQKKQQFLTKKCLKRVDFKEIVRYTIHCKVVNELEIKLEKCQRRDTYGYIIYIT